MLKNLKKAAAIVLSFAMAVQFGLADSYYVNAVEEPVEPQQQEETTTTAPQEQEEVPTTEEETPQQQEEGQQQPAVEEEQPAAEEAQPQPQPVEQAEVKVSYVKEDDTDLMESVTATYDVGYRLDQDTNVFKEGHEAFEFEYAFVNGNKENKITKDQVKASGLTVTSDMTSLTLVYKSTATQNESKDKKVETANLSGEKEDDSDSEDDIATVANNSIELKVGEKATLDSSDVEDWGYNHQHKWTVNKKNIVNLSSKSGSSITVTGEGVGTATVTDTYTYSSFMGGSKRGTKTYTINVTAAVTPTGISISGADTVKQFQTTQLTANLTPEGANGKVTWTSSNEQILSVDENGLVTGNRQGSATITASVQGADKNTLSATKTIEVVKNESPSSGNKREALVYYLKDPTKDANSNGSDQWGPSSLGTAVVNVEGATWTGNKNCFDNVDQRVLSWPTDLNGTNVVPRSNNAWNLIFDAYKASIEKELKVTITKDDVEEITLVPAKISKDNGTTPDMHLDCNVNIKCKSVALVKYWLFDANGTKYEMLGSKNYLVKDESTTQPSDVTSKKFPTTKTVDGVTYTFSGWYTDQSLTTPAPSFPAKVTGSVNYYAKYVAGYQVKYNLAGGQFSDGSTSATEKHNVDTTVVVKEVPTRKGYKFTGWTVEGLDGTTTINSGDTFTMPNGNVTLTANWQEQKIADFITLTPTDVIKPYDGKTYTAGTATVSGKTASPIPTDLKIEYSIDGKTWTTDPSTITATNVSDSKTVKVRVSSDNYTGKLEATEGLTINPAAVTVTITGNTKTEKYTGTEKSVTGYTSEKTNNLYTDADFGLKADAKAEAKGTNAGTYQMGLTKDSFKNKNANFAVTFEVTDGWLKIDQNEAKVTVTITGNKKTETYTGTEKSVTGYTTAVEGAKDSEVNVELKATAKAKAKGTDAKTYQMGLTEDSFTVTSNNYKNIKVVVKDGSLTINPAAVTVTITGNTKTEKYTGTEKSVTGYTSEKTNNLYTDADFGLKADAKAEAKGTNAGTYQMGLTKDSFENKNANFAVTFKVTDGWLKIDKKSIIPDEPKTPEEKKTGIKVTAPKDTTYSGNEQKKEPVIEDTKTGKTLNKDDYLLSYSSDVTNAGTVTITVTGKGNYSGEFTVTYKIKPRKVTLKSETASKPYDGTALTKPAVKVSGDGFVEGEVSDIKATGSVTTVSEGEVTNTITFTKENNYKAGNYTIDKDEGKLSIRAQSINPGTDPEKPNPDYTGAKVNSPSDEVYDGKEHKWIPTVTDKADKKLEAGTDYTVEYSTKNFKDVGTIDVTITGIGNYTGTVTRTYKITPKSVTVTADNKSKVFGETDPKLTAKVDGTLGNDTVDYKLSRKAGEDVGKYEITVKGDKLQGNYSVTYATGTLTITSQSIDPGTDPEKPNPDYTGAKVNKPSDSVYDGNEHKWSPTVTDKADKKLKAGTDYTVEYATKNFKDVGTIDVTITGKGNYSGTVKRSYKVTPKEYTVTTDSATKTYSGTALTAGGKVEGIVSGETVEFTTTGSQTEVGTSKNTYELVWKSAKATNYTLAKESIGELTVKAKSIVPDDKDTPESDKTGITVSEPSDSKYDGKEHKEVLTVTDTKTGKELVAGTDYSVTYSSDLVNAGTVTIKVAGLGNYTGSFAKTYKITKRSVTLTSATVSKVYDGSALTSTSITVSGDGFVEGEGASYEVTGSQTEVGNSANSFEYKLNENTLASNYNITKVVGTLTITAAPAPVTPATPSTPSSTPSTTVRTPSAPQVTTPVETVEKETTPKAEPKKEEKVEEEYTPKASPQYYWALINLICAILTVLFGLLLLISKRHKSEDDDEEDDDETKQQTTDDDESKEQEKKRGLFTRVLAVLIAIVSVVFFLVTEDLSLPWTWTDQWTIWMVVIGLVQIVVFFVGRKWKNVDDDEDEEEAQQA